MEAEMTTTVADTITMIPVAQLRPHPKNPRVALRQDVVDAIAVDLAERGHMEARHALTVRRVDDGYEIISGHHRHASAEAAGLEEVPCWLVEMDDDQAYMALATSNNQGEISPLEIGLHALHRGKGDKWSGPKGKKYAELVGRHEKEISHAKSAAQVYESVAEEIKVTYVTLRAEGNDKWRHLAAVKQIKDKTQWGQAVGRAFDETLTVEQCQRLADGVNAGQRVNDVKLTESLCHVANNSGDNEWYTPDEYLDAARRVIGEFDLDPASNPVANERVRAAVFYTAEDDGLAKDWSGVVWMNPPYESSLVDKFAKKLANSYSAGDVTAAVVLVNNGTETKWFQCLAEQASAICFPKGRVKFWHPRKEAVPLQGQAVLYLGDDMEAFVTEFSSFGFCMEVSHELVQR
jgi:phage N-6-adenine-methyltransferase